MVTVQGGLYHGAQYEKDASGGVAVALDSVVVASALGSWAGMAYIYGNATKLGEGHSINDFIVSFIPHGDCQVSFGS